MYEIVTMTSWLPDLSHGSGPLYLQLADQHRKGHFRRRAAPGTKLPPQRDLAYDIGVTIGTVGRAYALARERGLVSGEVGRGTFVLGRDVEQDNSHPPVAGIEGQRPHPGRTAARQADHGQHLGPGHRPGRGDRHGLPDEIARDNPDKIVDYTREWPLHWREAGSTVARRRRLGAGPQSVVPTVGVHAAAMAVIAAMTAPGDKIAFEQLTYSSISRSANLIGRRSVVMRTDAFGPDPEDFERLCAQQHPKLAFLIPSLHNPTLAIMPTERRREIAEIARKHNVWLIEDSIYGALLDEPPTPISAFAPERTFHVGGLSKIGCRRRARRMGLLPSQPRVARSGRAQDGHRRHAVPARRTLPRSW